MIKKQVKKKLKKIKINNKNNKAVLYNSAETGTTNKCTCDDCKCDRCSCQHAC